MGGTLRAKSYIFIMIFVIPWMYTNTRTPHVWVWMDQCTETLFFVFGVASSFFDISLPNDYHTYWSQVNSLDANLCYIIWNQLVVHQSCDSKIFATLMLFLKKFARKTLFMNGICNKKCSSKQSTHMKINPYLWLFVWLILCLTISFECLIVQRGWFLVLTFLCTYTVYMGCFFDLHKCYTSQNNCLGL